MVKINIWNSSKDNLNVMLFLRNYPRYHVIAIRKKLKNQGYILTPIGLYHNDNKIRINSIKDIYRYANLPYRSPIIQESKH